MYKLLSFEHQVNISDVLDQLSLSEKQELYVHLQNELSIFEKKEALIEDIFSKHKNQLTLFGDGC